MMQKKREAQAPKPGPKPKVNTQVNPSQKLANLLRREAMFAARARKAKADLKAVQDEIRAAWSEREKLSRELLDDGLEA